MSATSEYLNPLAEGLPIRRRPEPCTLVIFGASGDLTERKLMPALYSLAFRRLLPDRFTVVGAARSEGSDEWFRDAMKEAVKRFARDEFREEVWESLGAGMHYVQLDAEERNGAESLPELLSRVDAERATNGNRIYYFAVPPSAIEALVKKVATGSSASGWKRLIIEKPFGHDLASARELNALLGEYFTEREIFRIDHYLGKETVQNLLALRFSNGIFEPIWNRQFIDHVQITVAESIGIEGRAGYYEQAGAIRDIFQNHLLQLLAITAMEPPSDFTADSVRNEKVKVLHSLHTPGPRSVVRGQYGRGFVEGLEVPGYREEKGVAPDSTTETFVAAKLFVDNWRWADTPFYVRMGKRLARRETTIAIQFKRAPHPPFEETAVEGLRPNVLLIHVQPDEGLSLAIGAKVPGQGMLIRNVHMDFLYGSAFRHGLPEAYERLILDAMLGDATLFTRSDEIEEQWAIVDAIVAAWQRDRVAFPNYPAGTWGPPSADELLAHDGRSWGAALTVPVPALFDWSGTDVSIAEIESELGRLRRESAGEDGNPHQRTSVMTHVAWVPPEWLDAAEMVLAGMAERHPSRTVILVPRPGEEGGIDAELSLRCFPLGETTVCGEVIELSLRGSRALAPASIVLPLVISDLPVFLRWRGEPPFHESAWEQLVGVADRLVVDSSEWEALRYEELVETFERTAVSDLAWARTDDWRIELAARWPAIREAEIEIRGPRPEATLLRGWLQSRLERALPPIVPAAELGARLGHEELAPPTDSVRSPSDLLSDELDRFARDRIYEAAVAAS